MTGEADATGREAHVAVLEEAIAELAKDGWREFMTVWVDPDGSVVRDDIGKEARFPFGT